MQYKAIIFDLDGTLLDSLADIAYSVNAVLERHGFSGHPLQAYRYYIGDGINTLIERACLEPIREGATPARLVKEFLVEYRLRWHHHTRPYSGVPELLDLLEGRGVPKAIFSNKPHHFAVLTTEKLLPHWHFAAVQGSLPDQPLKPDPAGALAVTRQLGIAPEKCLYLGDTDIDMFTANRAGMYAVGALWGFRPAENLLAGGARQLVENPLDVAVFFPSTTR
ncbi:MAG: HAD family hydrolase [Bacillota bacterium]